MSEADPDTAALEAIRSSVERVLEQVVAMADRRRPDEEDPVVGELDELERGLRSTMRRLDRTLRRLE